MRIDFNEVYDNETQYVYSLDEAAATCVAELLSSHYATTQLQVYNDNNQWVKY